MKLNLLICILSISISEFVCENDSENVKLSAIGASVTLTCSHGAKTWYGPAGEIIEGTKYKINKENNTLTVSKVGEHDVGKYYCSDGQDNSSVAIESAPHVKALDKSFNVVQNGEIKMDCHGWGYPEVTYEWIQVKDDQNKVVGNSAHYNKSNVDFDDSGIYFCNLTNSIGQASTSTKVRVKDKLAPLWPFIGICVEIIILVVIIIIYEKHKSKQNEDELKESAALNSNDNNTNQDLRQRK